MHAGNVFGEGALPDIVSTYRETIRCSAWCLFGSEMPIVQACGGRTCVFILSAYRRFHRHPTTEIRGRSWAGTELAFLAAPGRPSPARRTPARQIGGSSGCALARLSRSGGHPDGRSRNSGALLSAAKAVGHVEPLVLADSSGVWATPCSFRSFHVTRHSLQALAA